jgi:hypothetical protein
VQPSKAAEHTCCVFAVGGCLPSRRSLSLSVRAPLSTIANAHVIVGDRDSRDVWVRRAVALSAYVSILLGAIDSVSSCRLL